MKRPSNGRRTAVWACAALLLWTAGGGSRSSEVSAQAAPAWSQQAYVKASNVGSGDWFGWTVAVSGDIAVVGAFAEKSAATGVNGDATDNTLTNAGAAYVFVRSGGVWSQQAYLKASNTGDRDQFGRSVAISGDTIVVGAPDEDSGVTGVDSDGTDNSAGDSGAAYVFVRSGGVWSQQAYLKASNTGAGDRFGSSVAVSGDTVAVGAYLEKSAATGVDGDGSDNSLASAGAAYVFVRSGGVWSQQAYLKASNTGNGDSFGASLAVSGDTVVVGAASEDSAVTGVDGDGSDNSASNAGAAYVFTRSGGVWSQQAYLKASNTGAGDRFGASAAVSGDTVVVGALAEASNATGIEGDGANDSASNAGAAYVFTRSGGVWSQQAYVKASNTGAGDKFGHAVAVSDDTMVVTAFEEDSSATGVDGDGTDNSAGGSGAAYVFTRSGGVWSQQAYLKASNTGAGDAFGYSVAVAGDTVMVGAHQEDSNAAAIDGDGTDDSAVAAGAAYVMMVPGSAPVVVPPPVPLVLPPLLPDPMSSPVVTAPVATTPPTTTPPTTTPSTTTPSTTGPPTTVPVVPSQPAVMVGEPPRSGTAMVTLEDGTVTQAAVDVTMTEGRVTVVVGNTDGSALTVVHEPLSAEAALVVRRGDPITISGEGYEPNTLVHVWLKSSPRFLGSAAADADGSFSLDVIVPGDVESGSHTLHVEGTAPSGALQATSLGFMVDEPTATLPATGTDPMVPWALLLLGAGLAMVSVVGRRASPAGRHVTSS